ncbi:MAG: WD40 repeat domain-containing protein [Anaerolineae bacterium]|nr:WD40 repeat domain-containing protein [Anaerolineae bacterium]
MQRANLIAGLVTTLVVGAVALAGYVFLVDEDAPLPPPSVPQAREEIRYLGLHVFQAVWSPDGTRLGAVGMMGGAQIWSYPQREPLYQVDGEIELVLALDWSPDGSRLATGSDTDMVSVWAAEDGSLLYRLPGHGSDITSVAWSPDGTLLASSSYDRNVMVWSFPAPGEFEARTFSGHDAIVKQVVWSPDGTRLASSSYDTTLRVWDLASGETLLILTGHTDMARGLAWSPDGEQLVSGSLDGTLRIWDARSGELLQTLDNNAEAGESIVFAPDGRRVAVGGGNSVRVFDAERWTEISHIEHVIPVRAVAWSRDGELLATAAADNWIRVWALR